MRTIRVSIIILAFSVVALSALAPTPALSGQHGEIDQTGDVINGGAPEIGPGAIAGTIALLTGGLALLRRRR